MLEAGPDVAFAQLLRKLLICKVAIQNVNDCLLSRCAAKILATSVTLQGLFLSAGRA